MAPPQVLALADVADGAGVLELDAAGRPVAPVALVDVAAAPPSPDAVRAAAGAARSAGRVLVGVAEGPVHPLVTPLLDALPLTLTVTGTARQTVRTPDLADAVDLLTAAVVARPQAAVAACGLLRLTAAVDLEEGLLAESFAYSMLLSGPEFAAWRAEAPRRPVPEAEQPVLLDRVQDTLHVQLNRPERRNAYGWQLRDALVEALELAVTDATIDRVELSGAGPSFSSGGDLDEFGTAPDVVAAHLIRTTRSAGHLLHRLSTRVHATVHGACVGAGIELPAFAGRVTALEGAWFQLPELRMGLVPGAGGTVSIPRRIGRWRTAWMALSGARVDLATALEWGLVDDRAD
jgi:hypothetical protein